MKKILLALVVLSATGCSVSKSVKNDLGVQTTISLRVDYPDPEFVVEVAGQLHKRHHK